MVAPGVDQERAAWKAVQHGESALAVVDDDGRFIGFLPPIVCSLCCCTSMMKTWLE